MVEKLLLACAGVALCLHINAQTSETVTVDGTDVNRFITEMTFSGDNVTVKYDDNTSMAIDDMSNLEIGFSYLAELNSTEDNSNATVLECFGGKVINVKVNCELTSDTWSPICLPFEMTAAQIETALGSGTQIVRLENATEDGISFETTTAIKAGIPYIINPSTSITDFTVEDVELKNLITGGKTSGTDYDFIGTIPAVTISGNNSLFFTGDKTLQPLAENTTVVALQGYMQALSASGARTMTYTIDGVADSIERTDGINPNKSSYTKVFNLNGQYLGTDTDGLAKGIYIINGKKTVIK